MIALRARTRSLHASIEREVNVIQRTRTRKEYAHLLARFYGFYLPVEARLDVLTGLQATRFDNNARRKVPLLRADMLCLQNDAPLLDEIEVCHHLPPLDTVAQALGALYVVEGATLGGQIISREILKNLHLTPECGGAFFASYGAQVGAMWTTRAAFAFCTQTYRSFPDIV